MSDPPRFPHEKALALAFAAEPRATVDIFVNLFAPVSRAGEVLEILRSLGVSLAEAGIEERLRRDEQVRLRWTGTWLDLFFSYSPLHDACHEGARPVRVLGQEIRVISAEDLAVFKVLFDRPKDWLDVESIVHTRGERFDADYVERWVDAVAGAEDPRASRLRALLRDRG